MWRLPQRRNQRGRNLILLGMFYNQNDNNHQGSNEFNQVGDGCLSNAHFPKGIDTRGNVVVKVALGKYHSLAVCGTGALYSWGKGLNGQLGHGKNENASTPTEVNYFSYYQVTIVQIATGDNHSACLTHHGDLYLFGCNDSGQLGTGTTMDANLPFKLSLPVGRVQMISSGANHMIVLSDSNTVYSWGNNSKGQLGTGDTENQTKPILIASLSSKKVAGIVAGGDHSTCVCKHQWLPNDAALNCMCCSAEFNALTRRRHHCRNCGGLFCDNCSKNRLQLATPTKVRVCDTCFSSLTTIIQPARDLKRQSWATWALPLQKKNNQQETAEIVPGHVYTFGCGEHGALGNDVTTNGLEPAVLKTIMYMDVTYVTCYGSAAVAVCRGGEVFTWGKGRGARLGIGNESDYERPKQVVLRSNSRIVKAAMGEQHTLLLSEDGDVFAMGMSDHGQIGIEGMDLFYTPTKISALSNRRIIDISCGHSHSGVVTDMGDLFCFGDNTYGQCGGENESVQTPTEVDAGENIVTGIALGKFHSLVVTRSGKVLSFGLNKSGQLGTSETLKRNTPAEIMFFSAIHAVQVSAGKAHSAVLAKNGDLYLFGSSSHGQCTAEKSVMPPSKVNLLLGERRVRQVTCGANHVIVLAEDNSVWSWGSNMNGQLGINSNTNQTLPARVTYFDGKKVSLITSGSDQSMCICEHQWVPDKDVKNCMACQIEFKGLKRRHHCRSMFFNTKTN
jgi:alpha-tubulin suppressor-like RCC1 family protein